MKYYIFTKSLLVLTLFISSGFAMLAPGVVNASCHENLRPSLSEPNNWTLTVGPCPEFGDTGIQFAVGDTLRITPYDGDSLTPLKKQFNGDTSADGSSVSGTVVSTQTQTLKLKNISGSIGGGFGSISIIITKIPAGATSIQPTNAPVPQTPAESIPPFQNPTGEGSVAGLLTKAIQILMSTIGAVAVIVIVIAGFRLVILGDSESERSSAKKSITWAILGLIFALMSFSIVTIIQRVLQT